MRLRATHVITILLAVVAALAVGGVSWTVWRSWGPPHRVPRELLPDVQPAATSITSQPDIDYLLDPDRQVEVIAGDLPGLPAPPGGRRIQAVRMGPDQELAGYLFTGTQDVLESFYIKALAERGWRQLPRNRAGALAFSLDERLCTVEYRARPGGRDAYVRLIVLTAR